MRESFAELQAAAKYGWAAKEREHEAALVAEVDKWIDEGRINVRMRAKAIEAMKHNADGARALYGANPTGTIPRREIGHGVDTDEGAKSRPISHHHLLSHVSKKVGNSHD